MFKKSEGLALQTIVIAALVIIVLIVLIAIFSGRIGFYGKSLDHCPTGKEVSDPSQCAESKGEIARPMRNSKSYCCIKVSDVLE